MTILILNTILCLLLGIIVYQDFKYRAIHVFLAVSVFAIGSILLWLDQNSLSTLINTSLFVITVVVLLWVYISLKQNEITNPFTNNIGIGDVLFFFAITPLFSFHNYIVFFITGMILTILFSLVFKKLIKNKFIPLAGILAGYLVLLKVSTLFMPVNFYYNPLLKL